ncbi:MAG: cobalamin-dependent protein [Phycisphaerae bacterium]|nr:cobalamin-dependent protein [Phycisphaerae bacterium]
MSIEQMQSRLFDTLVAGDRPAARTLVLSLIQQGFTPQQLITDLFWPTYQNIDRLHRADQLTTLGHHLAMRLLRVLVDQNASRLAPAASNGRSVYVFCGANEGDELGAQMATDMLEAHGFATHFAGGGIAADEILGLVHDRKPDVLVMFASAPGDLPVIRQLVDTITEIGACEKLQVAVGGGVFNRAEGLAEEIGADLWAIDPLELAQVLIEEPERRATADQRTVGKSRTAPKRKAA